MTIPAAPRGRSTVLPRAEWMLLLALPATVFAFAMGSGSVTSVARVGLTLRWIMLFALAAVALAAGWSNRARVPRSLIATVGTLGALGLLSAAWSVTPRTSAERAITFLLLTMVAAFVAAAATRSSRLQELVLVALLAGPVLVAVAGLVLLGVDHSVAVQPAQPGVTGRLRGFGVNPNADSMLFALVLPLAIWAVAAARSMKARAAAGLAVVLLLGSVLASGSRGAIFGSAGGAIIFALIRVRPLRLLVPTLAALAAFFAVAFSVAGTRPSTSGSTTQVSGALGAPSSSAESRGGRFSVELAPKMSDVPVPFVSEYDEIGFPGLYQYKPILAYGSGRVYIWLTAIKQGLARPLLGYGFGTERDVFVERSYIFRGLFTENSFVGMFLELGLVGVLLLLAPFVIVATLALRVVRRPTGDQRSLAAVGAASTTAGLVIAFFQSYLYSVGNVATLTFWVILFLAVALAARPARAAEAT
jgi:O-antigen ligase